MGAAKHSTKRRGLPSPQHLRCDIQLASAGWVINNEILELSKEYVSAHNPNACARNGWRIRASGWEQQSIESTGSPPLVSCIHTNA